MPKHSKTKSVYSVQIRASLPSTLLAEIIDNGSFRMYGNLCELKKANSTSFKRETQWLFFYPATHGGLKGK